MLLAIGCTSGDSQGRKAVQGEVTLDGTALATGAIRFEPQDPKVGTPSGAVISKGRYEIPPAQGLVPGIYRVYLTAVEASADNRTADEIMNNPGPPRKELIPAKYNRQSQLTVEIKAEGANRFDFPLKTK
jgi:hypothetical protein